MSIIILINFKHINSVKILNDIKYSITIILLTVKISADWQIILLTATIFVIWGLGYNYMIHLLFLITILQFNLQQFTILFFLKNFMQSEILM